VKEFNVYYTLDFEIICEKVSKGINVTTESVLKEVLEKIQNNAYLIIKNNERGRVVNTTSIRYVKVIT
jgi:hypothetical protein